jgi:hypothetical protein
MGLGLSEPDLKCPVRSLKISAGGLPSLYIVEAPLPTPLQQWEREVVLPRQLRLDVRAADLYHYIAAGGPEVAHYLRQCSDRDRQLERRVGAAAGAQLLSSLPASYTHQRIDATVHNATTFRLLQAELRNGKGGKNPANLQRQCSDRDRQLERRVGAAAGAQLLSSLPASYTHIATLPQEGQRWRITRE